MFFVILLNTLHLDLGEENHTMKLFFENLEPKEVVQKLQEQLHQRKWGDMVHFELVGEDMHVTIQKMGTSTLEFQHKKIGSLHEWTLTQEKIAFAHRAFKREMQEKIVALVAKVGGSVT